MAIDLSAPVRLAQVPVLARQVFSWWVAELKALAPAGLRRLFPKPVEAATLRAAGDVWRIVSGGEEPRVLELDARADNKGLADQILDAAPGFSMARLAVILPQASALRRRIELPIMPESDVRAAIELQIDRLSPFKADTVRFATRVIDRDPIEGKLTAEVAIAPRAPIEALEQRLAALGLKAVSIDVDAGNGAGAGFDLRATDDRATPPRALLINLGLACGVAVIWYLAGIAWETAREQEIESWQARIAELRPLAQRSAVLRQQIDGLTQPFEIARAHVPGTTLTVLTEVTKLLPDAARLSEFRLSGDTVEMTGLASEAPGLIAKLEASKLFKEVKFRSPVTRRAELNKDRFEISMKLEGPAR